jgi:diguanylate cyclase (GGDEF)-like protein
VKVQALLVDSRGTIWMGTEVGLARFDPVSATFELLRHRSADATSLPNDYVSAIVEDAEQRIWVGTANGLALLDRRTDRFTTFRYSPSDQSSLPDNNIVTLFQDRTELLWVGTRSGGIARWNPRSWSFGHQHLGDASDDNVTSFAEDRRGTLWVGAIGGGLAAVNRATGAIKRYRHSAQDPASLGDDNVMALVVDGADRVWIATMRSGVERLDQRNGRLTRFKHDPRNSASLGASGVMSLLRDSRERIWVGTYGGGLARIDPGSDKVTRYPVRRDGVAGLSSDRATALAEDRTGLIWIGTDGGGLNVLDPASGRFRSFAHVPDDPQSLSADTVYAVHVDERGVVWVGTRGGGLDQFIGSPFGSGSVSFRNFAEPEGLPNGTVYGIESDPGGQLWLSTNRGLVRFNPADGNMRVFSRSHGLQGDEFNFGAHYRSPAGELFFGGPRGYNAFFADRLRFNDKPPPLALTQFAKFNTAVNFGRTLESVSQISLGYRDDVVAFHFAALDFTAPAANRYAYKLEGFDQDWVQAGNSRLATYTNLAGGRYVFRVRGANSDGKWNEPGLAITVDVEAPPWARWWAFALYLAAFIIALYAVWAAQQRKLQREAAYTRRLSAEVEARTEELAQRNAELQRVNLQLQDASITDPLTGLGNRRFLSEAVAKLLPSHAAGELLQASPRFVLIIVDLDNLKPINDLHGHDAGDRVLCQVAAILKGLCRASDFVVRWGGDEFVLLCRDADLTAAAELAERIRSTVAKQIFRVYDGLVVRTSCSIGFAPFPFIADAPASVTWEQTLAIADAALYQAKRDRNDWVGWGGTALAAELPNLQKSIETDLDSLNKQGVLDIRRRALAVEDTVDRLRSPARGDLGGDGR